jgi:hypothetical protein
MLESSTSARSSRILSTRAPARRVPRKTAAAIRDSPLIAQPCAHLLRYQRQSAPFTEPNDVFITGNRTPLGHRNVEPCATSARLRPRERQYEQFRTERGP